MKKNLRKIAELFYVFLTMLDEVEKYVERVDKLEAKVFNHVIKFFSWLYEHLWYGDFESSWSKLTTA